MGRSLRRLVVAAAVGILALLPAPPALAATAGAVAGGLTEAGAPSASPRSARARST